MSVAIYVGGFFTAYLLGPILEWWADRHDRNQTGIYAAEKVAHVGSLATAARGGHGAAARVRAAVARR